MELLLSAIILGIVSFVGLVNGWKARERKATRTLQQFVENAQEQEEEDTIHILIEKHNGVLFVYDMRNSSFLAQGNDRKDIEEALRKRFPGKRFACPESNMIEVGLKP